MTPDQLAGLATNELLQGRLAKTMALECFRTVSTWMGAFNVFQPH